MLKKLIICAGLAVTPVLAADKASMVNELSGEYQECSVYFAIASEAISRFSDTEVAGASKLAGDYKQAQETAVGLATELALTVGGSPQAFTQRTLDLIKHEKDLIQSSFVNISLLNARYATFCQRLMKDPSSRMLEIEGGNPCNREYKCWK